MTRPGRVAVSALVGVVFATLVYTHRPHTACETVQAYTNAGYAPTDRQKNACALQRMKELREIDSE